MVNSSLFLLPPPRKASPEQPRGSVRDGRLSSTPILASPALASSQSSTAERIQNAVTGRLGKARRATVNNASTTTAGHRASELGLDIPRPVVMDRSAPTTDDAARGDTTGAARSLPRAGLLPHFMRKSRSQSHSTGSPTPLESANDPRGSSLARLAGWASRSSVFLRSDMTNSTTDLPLPSSPLNTRRPSASSVSESRTPSRRASESSPPSEDSLDGRRVSGYGFFRRGSAASSGIGSHENIAESPIDGVTGQSSLAYHATRLLTVRCRFSHEGHVNGRVCTTSDTSPCSLL